MTNYLEDLARANLSPKDQQIFFAEQEQIKEDIARSEAWFHRTEEAMRLTPDQIEFLRKHKIHISTAYIGMVRFYIENRTIFQTSSMDSIARAMSKSHERGTQSLIDYDGLTEQVHEYLNLVISASPKVLTQLLNRHVPLFGPGELDQIREICKK